MAVPPVAAPAPAAPAAAAPARPPAAAAAPHARPPGIFDILSVAASVLYAVALFVLCVFGTRLLTPDAFNHVQDTWGIITTAFVLIQVLPVLARPDSYKHTVIGKAEVVSSLATIVAVAVVFVLYLVGAVTYHHWAFMMWLNALFAGLIDLAVLWHTRWLTQQH